MENESVIPPLNTWQKIKAGVRGFFKMAIEYIPRGILFSAVIFGGSALIGHFTGWDPLNVIKTFNANPMDLVHHAGMSMLIGGAISGAVGAYQGVQHAGMEHKALNAEAGEYLERNRATGPERQQYLNQDSGFAPQKNLPIGSHKTPTRLQPYGH